jgi:hypothetical protein
VLISRNTSVEIEGYQWHAKFEIFLVSEERGGRPKAAAKVSEADKGRGTGRDGREIEACAVKLTGLLFISDCGTEYQNGCALRLGTWLVETKGEGKVTMGKGVLDIVTIDSNSVSVRCATDLARSSGTTCHFACFSTSFLCTLDGGIEER